MASEKDVNAAITATSDKIDLLVSQIVQTLRKGVGRLLGGINAGTQKALEIAKQIKGLDSALKTLGLYDKIDKVEKLYQAQVTQVINAFDATGVDVDLTRVDSQVVESLINFDVQVIESRANLAVDSIRSMIMRSVILGEKPSLESLEKQALEPLERSLTAELNTSMAGFDRSVTFRKAETYGITKFVYRGPLDKVTRPFCREHVNKIYTLDEIEAMDNGQGLPVKLYGGGYNCRHRWQPLSDERAAALGWKPAE